jgi:CheY-like chemotaxis protein
MPKVLVVDDSVSVRKVVERILASRHIEVVAAASGDEALTCLEDDTPDLIVCDVILPDQDGYQICEFVRAHPRLTRVPVLLISGMINSTVLSRAAEVRSNDVMFKPFTADELVRKISGLLAAPLAGVGGNGSASRWAPAPNGSALAADTPPPGPAAPPAEGSGLAELSAIPGVGLVIVVDREGFVIDVAGRAEDLAEVAGSLAAVAGDTADAIGRELGEGGCQAMIIEFDTGLLLLHAVGREALVAVMLRDAAALGKVRYHVKKLLPALEGAL